MVRATQVVITAPFAAGTREVDLAGPNADQILIRCHTSAISAGTELAVYTGSHQWLQDPKMVDWKFPFRSGYSAAGVVEAVGKGFPGGFEPGDRVCYPGNHASHEVLTVGHERCRVWKMPDALDFDKAAVAVIARYGLGAPVRAGLTLGRSAAVLGLGIIGQFALRALIAAGASPVVGIDAVPMRRAAALAAGADAALDPAAGPVREQLSAFLGARGAEIVADATGVPDAIPTAMSLACDAGQVVVVGSPRGKAKEVNFYDDLHRRYIEVTGAHGNMLFEPAHTRLAGAWDIDKAQTFLLRTLASGRLSLAGLVTHTITPAGVDTAYQGLLHNKDEYLGVLVKWA